MIDYSKMFLIYDNDSVHMGADVDRLLESKSMLTMTLLSYTPEFSEAEIAIIVIKARLTASSRQQVFACWIYFIYCRKWSDLERKSWDLNTFRSPHLLSRSLCWWFLGIGSYQEFQFRISSCHYYFYKFYLNNFFSLFQYLWWISGNIDK